MKPLCDLCGDRHESWQGHRFASNAASNTGAVGGDSVERGVAALPVVQARHGRDGEGVGQDLKQRWSRESYNAYQREYMRERRKNKK